MLANLITVISCLMCFVMKQHYLVLAGRLVYGLAVGIYQVFTPKYVSEFAPTEVKGPAGTLSQLQITFGIMVPFAIGNFFSDTDDEAELTTQLYVLFAIPLVSAVLQSLLLLTAFNFETPEVLKQRKQYETLRRVFAKIFHPSAVQEKIDELLDDGPAEGVLDNQEEEDKGFKAIFFSPKYRKASWFGVALSIGLQTTGINLIMFYSNTLFSTSLGMPAERVTALIGVVNFVTTFGGLFLLSITGRRTIMVFCSLLTAIDLFLVGYFIQTGHAMLTVATVLIFIALFEFSYGPVTWLYLSEALQDKAIGVATMLNNGVAMGISIATPYAVKAIGEENIGTLFYGCGVLTGLNFLIICLNMVETRGKTFAQIQQEYSGEYKKVEIYVAKPVDML